MDYAKVKISLSNEAYEAITLDKKNFQTNSKSATKFYNKLLINFCKAANTNVFAKRREQKEKYLKLIKQRRRDIIADCAKKDIADAVINAIIDCQYKAPNNNYAKDHSASINLYDDTLDLLSSAMENDSVSEDFEKMSGELSVGLYTRALLEEYGHLPLEKREQYYFSEEIECIKSAIRDYLVIEISNGRSVKKYVPYKIKASTQNKHQYLVGFDYYDNGKIAQKPVSIKISNVAGVSLCNNVTYKLTEEYKQLADDAVAKKGVEYLTSKISTIKVRLTKEGIKKYEKQITHNRPAYNTVDVDSGIYTFDCTEQQVLRYFLRFGEDAEILEPRKLRIQMKKILENAAKLYSDDQ